MAVVTAPLISSLVFLLSSLMYSRTSLFAWFYEMLFSQNFYVRPSGRFFGSTLSFKGRYYLPLCFTLSFDVSFHTTALALSLPVAVSRYFKSCIEPITGISAYFPVHTLITPQIENTRNTRFRISSAPPIKPNPQNGHPHPCNMCIPLLTA